MLYMKLYDYLVRNDSSLSRTVASGVIDDSVSSDKKKAKSRGLSVEAIIERNRRLACDYIAWRSVQERPTYFDLISYLSTLSEIINRDMSGNSFFRTWDLEDRSFGGEAKLSTHNVPLIYFNFLERYYEALRSSRSDLRFDAVSEIEWEVGIGPMHPFADGCGRASRYFSALLSLVFDCNGVVYCSREMYYKCGALGRRAFVEYRALKRRVSICL